MDTNINENVLKNCYKNAKMAVVSLDEVIPRAKGELKEELIKQNDGYNDHIAKIALTAAKLGITLPEVNPISKGMLNASIAMKSLMDDSNSHIAEMTLKGTVTGYTTLLKDISEFSPLLNEDILERIVSLKEFEEECEQTLKKFI